MTTKTKKATDKTQRVPRGSSEKCKHVESIDECRKCYPGKSTLCDGLQQAVNNKNQELVSLYQELLSGEIAGIKEFVEIGISKADALTGATEYTKSNQMLMAIQKEMSTQSQINYFYLGIITQRISENLLLLSSSMKQSGKDDFYEVYLFQSQVLKLNAAHLLASSGALSIK